MYGAEMGEERRADSRELVQLESLEHAAGQGSVAPAKDLDNLLAICLGRVSGL